jgi:quinoprotein glucose dehydrogenase
MNVVSFILLLATGLGMAVPGLYLATLGGSFYYAIAGALITVSAVLVLKRRDSGIVLYLLVFAVTIAWTLMETGLDGWAMMPRLVFLAGGAIWLLLTQPKVHRLRLAGVVAALLVLSGAVYVHAQQPHDVALALAAGPPAPVSSGEWANYGNSQHATRYSPLDQITPANASNLVQAWTYHTGLQHRDRHSGHQLELTPLMVDGLLFGCNAHTAVFALDPVTGREVWRHDTPIDAALGGRGVCRGVSFFRAPAGTTECPTRILVGTVDNRLIALDANTGKSCSSFGKEGAVDLSEGEGLGKYAPGLINPTSPPAIVRGTAVIGSYVVDNMSTDVPPGVIRGYDAVTGKLKWAFDPGRPDKQSAPGEGQTYVPSTPNSWPPFSGDDALGLVYLPMGNGSPDYYGPKRTPETDRFGTAVVALDAETGAVRWTFQAIHHDLWDYDLAAQPVLADFPVGNTTVPALIQATKTGQIFVLDRRTGKPITRVEEKPVPASTIPGERWSHTQPFSTGMPDFSGPRLTEVDMWGITPFDQLYCRIQFRKARYDGIFTPLQFGPSIRTPGELGGIDWGSVSLDERNQVLIVNSNLMADHDELISRQQADKEHLFIEADPRGKNAPKPPQRGAAMAGTPYGLHFDGFLTALGIPCQRPPYGYLAAVDLKTRKIVWQHPLGNASNSGPFGVALGLPLSLGTPNIGGSIVTAGGVIFIAATQDKYFRAIDERNGKVVWETRLPAGGHATPMTYKGRDGAQYVLIAAGGSGGFKSGSSDSIIAYRLKQ